MLMISAKRGQWRDRGGFESVNDKEFKTRRPQAIARDGGRCRFCNAKMSLMHVHHADDDHSNNDLGNLMTVDVICHSINHVGLLGKAGVMAYLPALTQEDVVNLTRAMLVVIHHGGEHAEEAKKLAQYIFSSFTEPVIDTFGSCDAADFGNALLQLSDSSYASRGVALKDLRVVFNVQSLSKTAGQIAKDLYLNSPDDIVSEWTKIAADIDSIAEMDE